MMNRIFKTILAVSALVVITSVATCSASASWYEDGNGFCMTHEAAICSISTAVKETRSVSVTEDGDYILTVISGNIADSEIGPAIMAMRLPVHSAEGVGLDTIASIDFGDLDAYRDCSELGSAIWFDGADMHEAIAVPGYEHLSIERIWLDGVFGDFEYAITAA